MNCGRQQNPKIFGENFKAACRKNCRVREGTPLLAMRDFSEILTGSFWINYRQAKARNHVASGAG
jgi:hypothetical protein